MAEINFFVEQTRFALQNKTAVRNWLVNSARKEKKSIEKLNYIFCTDEYLLSINKTYLNHATLTDIITFSTEGLGDLLMSNSNKNKLNGEIYISIDRVKENAKIFNVKFTTELHRVMIHGLMHLCGYGDKSAVKKKQMRGKEDYYLAQYSSK